VPAPDDLDQRRDRKLRRAHENDAQRHFFCDAAAPAAAARLMQLKGIDEV
jgi:hypothetical protein